MERRVIPTTRFDKEVKPLLKRYVSLKNELLQLEQELIAHPRQGVALGQSIYKIRVAIKSKGKGKSGGARVITYVVTNENEIYLLSIYDKSDIDAVDLKSLREMIKSL
jgi:mRNA-degrading endonuclease RelE of RelBE toxin-antitoxin system